MLKWNTKCRFFDEKYACDTLTSENYKDCQECKFSSEYSKKILIIKLGSLGDVIRTTSILEAIKKKYPDSFIHWLTSEESSEILVGNYYIDKILVFNLENTLRIQQEKFDILFALEIDTPTTILANLIDADEKFGYYFDNGATSCFNKGAEEYLETAFLTHTKLSNRKTYQELIFWACEVPYNKEEPIFELTEKDKEYAKNYLSENEISEKDKIIGINFSSGRRWPSKSWSNVQVKKFVKEAQKLDYKIILLGGPEEKEKLTIILNEFSEEGIKVFSNNLNNSIKEFASIINRCDKIITTDSLALHISIALQKPTIALFFSTPSWEIEDYERTKKVQSNLTEKHFFLNNYSDELANSITAEQILSVLGKS